MLEPGFSVVLAGHLGIVQALGTVLDAAELLLKNVDVRIILVGSGKRSDGCSKTWIAGSWAISNWSADFRRRSCPAFWLSRQPYW